MDVLLRKQKITIKTSDEQLGFHLRQVANESLKGQLQNMMESVFSKRGLSSTNLYIDKLFLDLGDLSAEAFKKDFVALTETELIESLNRLFQGDANHTPKDPPIEGNRAFNDPSLDDPAPASYKLTSQKQKELEALLYFLENGNYPWWFQNEKSQQEPPALLKKALIDQGEELVLQILSLRKGKSDQIFKKILTRLFIHSNDSGYIQIITAAIRLLNNHRLSQNVELIMKNTDQIKKALFTEIPLSTKDFHQFLFTEILLHDYEGREDFLYHFLHRLMVMTKADALENSSLTANFLSADALKVAFLKIIDKGASRGNTGKGEKKVGDSHPPETPQAKGPVPDDKKSSGNKLPDGDKDTEAIYIDNAGLLLLHPFLPALFAQSGILAEDRQFVSIEAQQKAAVLLFYIQSGEVEYKEWDMAFNKVLCGLNHQDVLEDNLSVSHKDKENCDQLLEAVIEHWEALKGASVPALRQTFISREGKLSQKEEHWLVQVERTGVDVLLDRLPWGYGVIKLPWLKNMIFTEW